MIPPDVARRYFLLTRGRRRALACGLAIVFVTTLLSLPAPWILKVLVDEVLPQRDAAQLGFLVLVLIVCSLARGGLTLLRNRVFHRAAMGIVTDLRMRLFAHLNGLSLSYFDRSRSAEVCSRITRDSNEVYELTTGPLINLFTDLVMVVSVVALLLRLDWKLTLACAVVVPLFVITIQRNLRSLRSDNRLYRDHLDKIFGFLQERVAGARVVKAFAREEAEGAAFLRGLRQGDHLLLNIVQRSTSLAAVSGVFSTIGALVVIGYGGMLVVQDRMAIGTLIAFNGYLTCLFAPIGRFFQLAATFQRANIAFENIWELLETKTEVEDRPNARELPRIRGAIEFRNVSFSYRSAEAASNRRPTLDNVSFRIPPGTIIAIVGPSGSSKSTIMNLVARFYDVTAGAVLIDGLDVRDVTINSLRRQMGVVLQDSILFSGTIHENIAYGRDSATREEVISAATTAMAHEFITAMPDGYDSLVGERGVTLSGGQRQRIAIARALLRDPRILLFDEATSALDPETEALLQAAMDGLLRNRTVIMIAHRPSSIQRADVVLVMKHGRIAEQLTGPEMMLRARRESARDRASESRAASLP